MSVTIDDASGMRGEADELLVPSSAEEVAEILARAAATGTPVTPSGAGTGVTGGRVPNGGWELSTERFKRLEVRPGRAWVGAGLPLSELQTAATASGQLYAPDPTEWSSSLGGNIATNASGSRSFLYGSTRRYVQSLTVALMDGTVRTFRRGERVDFPYQSVPQPKTTKNTAGYYLVPDLEWVDLICGSEGTLGVVLEAEVELLKQPQSFIAGVVFFDGDEAALAAVESWRGIPQLRMLEYMDAPSLDFLRATYGSEIPLAARACLMVEQELDGLEGDAVDEWVERMEASSAFEDSWFGETVRDRERFRVFRHQLPEAVNASVRQNGLQKLSSDFAVPIARNGEMLRYYKKSLGDRFPKKFTIFGHIGDAHVHVNILSEVEADFEAGKEWMAEAAAHAVALGGTVSAEHGLGKRKRHLLKLMYTAGELESMKDVKRRLDPGWLLARGTLWEESVR